MKTVVIGRRSEVEGSHWASLYSRQKSTRLYGFFASFGKRRLVAQKLRLSKFVEQAATAVWVVDEALFLVRKEDVAFALDAASVFHRAGKPFDICLVDGDRILSVVTDGNVDF